MDTKVLIVINYNANGLRRQIAEIPDFLVRHEADILCVTETFLRQNEPFSTAGYSVFRTARAVLIKRHIQAALNETTRQPI